MERTFFTKPMCIMLISMGLLFGSLFAYKLFTLWAINRFIHNQENTTAVSAAKIDYQDWQPLINASGTLRAINGVNITTEIGGIVKAIYFKPGTWVKKGTPLLQLNAATELGQLQAIQANAELAKITYQRDLLQYAIHAISQQNIDSDRQTIKNLNGQLAQQLATIAKKTLSAPFSGWLGINQVNLGQYLNPGNAVVTLQTLNPIYVDFYVPQQRYGQLHLGQPVILTSDGAKGQSFQGTITTINPSVDPVTRNVEVEATISNHNHRLIPGMFANVTIHTGAKKLYLTITQSAVSFNPYGNVIYVLKPSHINQHGVPVFSTQQSFVTTGPTRGDQIAILKGVKAGTLVVTSGQLKLINGSHVTINNQLNPSNNPNPILPNEH